MPQCVLPLQELYKKPGGREIEALRISARRPTGLTDFIEEYNTAKSSGYRIPRFPPAPRQNLGHNNVTEMPRVLDWTACAGACAQLLHSRRRSSQLRSDDEGGGAHFSRPRARWPRAHAVLDLPLFRPAGGTFRMRARFETFHLGHRSAV